MAGTVHIIGAGLAGLAAAVALTKEGQRVRLHEGAGHAGGRCRSFHDATLDRRIDNGNHLLLSGNWAAQTYLDDIGADRPLVGPERAEFPFVDLKTDERWTVKPDTGVIPWSLFRASGRVPGTGLGDYLRGMKLAVADQAATIKDCLGGGQTMYERFWEPLAVGVLNTPLDQASAQLLWPVIKETFGRGEAACRPRVAREGLSESFVDPALAYLERAGQEVRFNRRLRDVERQDDKVSALRFAGDAGDIEVADEDAVILALPPWQAASFLPGMDLPTGAHAIVNGHFRLPEAADRALVTGVVGGVSHWIFTRGDIASVTVSAADDLAAQAPEKIAALLWPEIRQALDLRGDMALPPYRIVKEKRATFSQTPAEIAKRPGPVTPWVNMFLGGDWTDTKIPATIEGTIRSGNIAARSLLKYMTKP